MTLIIIILFVFVVILFYKVGILHKHINVLSFSEKNIDKLLIKKKIIKISEIETVVNESIGDMPEDIGNKIIEDAKSMGIVIPKYMDDGELKKYIETQELKRTKGKISITDQMMLENHDL